MIAFILQRAKPKTPPSITASSQREESVTKSIINIMKNKNFIMILIYFSLINTVYNLVTINIDFIV